MEARPNFGEGLGEGPTDPLHTCATCSTPQLRGEVTRIPALLSGLLATRVSSPRPAHTGGSDSQVAKRVVPRVGVEEQPVLLFSRPGALSSPVRSSASGQGLAQLCWSCSAGLDITLSRDQVPWRDGFLPPPPPTPVHLAHSYIFIFLSLYL